ncbi:MAG: general secretion pathway protein GspK [Rhodobacteraceae bacterium]|nr:general secretion pathway protein GspK [Paracoccaceae bacterium]
MPKLDGTPFTLEISGQTRTLVLQDVNGLIDINSASRGLLTAFLEQIGSGNHIESILAQRATKQFSSIEEFSKRLSRANTVNLNRLLTVNSGRRRINNQTAPIELLQILARQNGSRAQMTTQIDRRFLRVRPVTDVLVFRNQSGATVLLYTP